MLLGYICLPIPLAEGLAAHSILSFPCSSSCTLSIVSSSLFPSAHPFLAPIDAPVIEADALLTVAVVIDALSDLVAAEDADVVAAALIDTTTSFPAVAAIVNNHELVLQ